MDYKDDMMTLEDTRRELLKAQRTIKRLERDNRLLVVINENSERLRQFNENERRLQNLYNELLLANCPNMIFLFDENHHLLLFSGACRSLLRETEDDDLSSMEFKELFSLRIKPEWIQKIYADIKNANRLSEAIYREDIIEFPDSEYMRVTVEISPVIDLESQYFGALLVITDNTELIEARTEAEQAARSKSLFLANMSHEIRTPMNAIKGLSELLALSELTKQQTGYLRSIIDSANSLLGIINDVLDFSKIDAGKMEILEKPYQVADLINETNSMMGLKSTEKGLIPLIELDPQIPSVLIGDSARIKQIIVNVLGNAVKYTHEGYIRTAIHMDYGENSPSLIVEIQDTGIGIKKEDTPALFDAFSRLDLITNRNIPGTGLGLAITKSLVDAMKGEIAVRSVYGEGSTFTIKIPQKVEDPSPLAALDNPSKHKVLIAAMDLRSKNIAYSLEKLGAYYALLSDDKKLSIHDITSFDFCVFDSTVDVKTLERLRNFMHNAIFVAIEDMRALASEADKYDIAIFEPVMVTDLVRVLNKGNVESGRQDEIYPASSIDDIIISGAIALVVDDNELNLIVGGEMLRSYGLEVITAPGGRQAIELCDEQVFDIIFMDHMMPDMDGIETTIALRVGDGMNKGTPIVALTANVVGDMKDQYLKSGMNDFIGKPIDIPELSRILRTWIAPHKIRRH